MGGRRAECRVERDADVIAAQVDARNIAIAIGFSRREATEIAIVTTELCTNALKYGVRGNVVIEAVDDPSHGAGVRVTVFDEGPPFADFEAATRDRFDERGPIDPATYAKRRGIGGGLGAVSRFSDAYGWAPVALCPPSPHAGPAPHHERRRKYVWAVRWLDRPLPPRPPRS
jgi:anti-sigma regulatory factor (Ser/Thr protein kinase)